MREQNGSIAECRLPLRCVAMINRYRDKESELGTRLGGVYRSILRMCFSWLLIMMITRARAITITRNKSVFQWLGLSLGSTTRQAGHHTSGQYATLEQHQTPNDYQIPVCAGVRGCGQFCKVASLKLISAFNTSDSLRIMAYIKLPPGAACHAAPIAV